MPWDICFLFNMPSAQTTCPLHTFYYYDFRCGRFVLAFAATSGSSPRLKPAAPAWWLQSRPSPMDRWRFDRRGNDRYWHGWYQSPSGMWHHPDQQWSGWGRSPWYPRDAVYDANGNIAEPPQVEGWEEAMQAKDRMRGSTAVAAGHTRHNPQEDAGDVLGNSAWDRVRMDITWDWDLDMYPEQA